MTTKAKLNPKEVLDEHFEEKAQLKAVEEKIYQTMEVSVLLTQITEQKVRIEELKGKCLKVEEEQRIEKETYLKASRKWERDLDEKILAYEKLTQELENTKKEHEDKIQLFNTQKEEEIAGLKSEIYSARLELNKRVGELKEELMSLKEFKEKQEEYYNQLDYWKKRCDELIHTHNDDLKRIDNQNSRSIQMQQDKHEKEINQIMHDAKKEAEQEVEKLEKKVIEDNKKLHIELLEYKKEIEILKREKERAVEENRQIKQNISLQEDGAIEYQAVHFRQESKIKKLKEKIQVLKNYIAQEVNKHTKELEATKYQSQVSVNEYEIQIQTLRDELKMRIKENKNLKALSQIILDQRSEVEEFLLETLDHVKEEVKKQKALEKKTRLPDIWNKSSPSVEPKSSRNKNWEKIEFTSLDWDDKEKILRILFSKMNSGLLPGNWRSNVLERSNDSMSNQALNSNSHQSYKSPLRE